MSKGKRPGVKRSTKAKAKPKTEWTGVVDVPESLEAHAREQGHITRKAMDEFMGSVERSSSYPRRDEITSGTVFRVFNGRAVVDATITYGEATKWSALVRLSIDANEIRHRFTDTRSISSESHEVASSPREGILLAMLQMCINRLGTFAEVEIAEKERDHLVGELMRAGFDDAARKVGSW